MKKKAGFFRKIWGIKKAFFVAAALLLLLLSIVLAWNIAVLNTNISGLNKDIAGLKGNISSLESENAKKASTISSLNGKISALNGKISLLEKEKAKIEELHAALVSKYSVLDSNYLELKKEALATIDEINSYKKSIDESMDWFKLNSGLLESETGIRTYMTDRCFRIEEDRCYIKTGCIYLTNSEFLKVSYKSDDALLNSGDKLLPLAKFVENNGGDCEDYALFFKAEYNYFLEKCESLGKKLVFTEAWFSSASGTRQFVDFLQTWSINNAKTVTLTGFFYPNVVCGMLPDLRTGKTGGHCVIALTKKKITGIESVFEELDGAPLVEPQDGSFLGYINDSFSGVFINKNSDDSEHYSYIFSIITDNDYFLFDKKKGFSWISYSSFKKKLENEEASLLKAIG